MSKTDILPIEKIAPSKDNYRKQIDENSLKELSASIAKDGIIQSLVVRPNGKPGMYEIICGERRYRAAQLAGLKQIPVNIRELTDDEAFEVRIAENLHRKDVHPMDEAIAYKTYRDQKNLSLDELSAKFGKPKEYIAHRISFNNLIDELKKEFYEGTLLITHAIVFARLTPENQKWCMKNCKITYGAGAGHYLPLKGVEDKINQELICLLTKAPFNPHDEKLVVNAGSCDNCPKRSGQTLFSDIKEKDRCFDGACYALKTTRHILQKLEEAVSNNDDPDTVTSLPIARGYNGSIDKTIQKFLEEKKITVLSEYNDFNTADKKDKGAVKALYVAGTHIGETGYIVIKAKEKSSGKSSSPAVNKNSPQYIDEQITNHKKSMELAKNNVEDKVLEEAVSKLVDLKPYREPDGTPLTDYEWAMVFYSMADQINNRNFDLQKELRKIKLTAKVDDHAEEIEKLKKAPQALKNFIVRQFIYDTNDFNLDESDHPVGYGFLKIAEQFKGVNVATIRKQHQADLDKQIADLSQKIKDLQAKKRELASAAPAPAKSAAKAGIKKLISKK